jgi:hypothetical protein
MTSDNLARLERAARRAVRSREAEARKDKAIRDRDAAESQAIVDECQKRIVKDVPRLASRYPVSQLERLHRIACDLEGPDGEDVIWLPSLYICRKRRRAFLEWESPKDASDERYIWSLYPRLELRELYIYKNLGGHNYGLAHFNSFSDLVEIEVDPACYRGFVRDQEDPYWSAKAAIAICIVRLLEFVRTNRLIPLAAKRLKEGD